MWITTTTVLSQFLSGLSLGVGFESGKKKEENIGIQNQFSNPGFPIGILENHVDFSGPFPQATFPNDFFRYDLTSEKRPGVVPQRPWSCSIKIDVKESPWVGVVIFWIFFLSIFMNSFNCNGLF